MQNLWNLTKNCKTSNHIKKKNPENTHRPGKIRRGCVSLGYSAFSGRNSKEKNRVKCIITTFKTPPAGTVLTYLNRYRHTHCKTGRIAPGSFRAVAGSAAASAHASMPLARALASVAPSLPSSSAVSSCNSRESLAAPALRTVIYLTLVLSYTYILTSFELNWFFAFFFSRIWNGVA